MNKSSSSLRSYRMAVSFKSVFNSFFQNQAAGGIVLLVCAVLAILVANIPTISHLDDIWDVEVSFSVGKFGLGMPLINWVNDALMAIFFFVVGLEIKREILVGELSSFKHAALPVFAAVGGMAVPALIYAAFNSGTPSQSGWGIPMATDIAFALGVLSLLGKRIPVGLKVFLAALAIADDLGAIIVLALFYPSHAVHVDMLAYAALVVVALVIIGRLRVRNVLAYILPGMLLWYFVYSSGIHATISGVLLALTIPSKTTINEVRFQARMEMLMKRFRKNSNAEVEVLANSEQQEIIHAVSNNVRKINPLMHRFEHALSPWVSFFIMPVFALANSGVALDSAVFSSPVQPLVPGIFFGLLVGKPLGIFIMSFIVVKLGIAKLPEGTTWVQILSLGIIAGIGFTMSIFIDGLAFSDKVLVDTGKATILMTSFCAALIGLAALRISSSKGNKGLNNNKY